MIFKNVFIDLVYKNPYASRLQINFQHRVILGNSYYLQEYKFTLGASDDSCLRFSKYLESLFLRNYSIPPTKFNGSGALYFCLHEITHFKIPLN